MIVVNCSQCRARLEMDDAFAGGVCRCHFCGTIQTVPAQAKLGAALQAPAPAPVANARRTGTAGATAKSGDGLDALAQAVASSQSRAGMRVAPQTASAPPAAPAVDYAHPPQQKTLSTPLIVALAVIVLLLGAVGFLVVGSSSTVTTGSVPTPAASPNPSLTPTPPPVPNHPSRVTPRGGAGNGGGSVTPPPALAPEPDASEAPVPRTPNFCGIDLAGVPSVVYVLDRGQATAELFDTLKEATYRSVESLKPGQKFQIIFWDTGGDITCYPPDGPAPASGGEVENARTQFADVIAGGRATPEGAIQRAVQSRPTAIVLVTGKAFDLEPDLVRSVDAALAGAPIRVHTVALKTDDGNPVLKQIADKTHGEFRVVTGTQLRKFSY